MSDAIKQSPLPLLMNAIYYAYDRALPKPDGSNGAYQPVKNPDGSVTTFCNLFVNAVALSMGYNKFDGLNANKMVALMADPANGWVVQDETNAQYNANRGVIVVPAWSNPAGHGHVCLVVPGVLEKSNSFGRPVPKVVNVGKDVFFGRRASFAFSATSMPTYYALGSMIS